MTLWDNLQGFEFHYFEPLEENPILEPFDPLVSVWRSKIDGRRIPKWSDFDFMDFRGWHSRLAIQEIFYNPFNYRFKLTGEEYNQVFGRNMQGLTREQLKAITLEEDIAGKFHEKFCTEMLIAFTKGVNIINRQHVEVEFVELPLSDNGLHATHTIEACIIKKL